MDWLRASAVDAAQAASRAGVAVHSISSNEDLERLRTTMASIWGDSIVPPRNLLRGMAMAGCGILLATREREVVGFALGFIGWTPRLHFHSHQVGVVSGIRSSGVGLSLKMEQRRICLEHGITEIRWTYDPMLRHNAGFNIARLGAEVIEFIPNCYGDRIDQFNMGESTDRVKVSWKLDHEIEGSAQSEPSAGALVLVDGHPMRSPIEPTSGMSIAIPDDHLELQVRDPGRAVAWRTAVASAIRDSFDMGLSIASFGKDGYVLAENGDHSDVVSAVAQS